MVRRFTRPGLVVRDSYERSQALRARHGRFAKPDDPAAFRADVRRRMQAAEKAALDRGLPRPCWHFRPEEVDAIGFDDSGQLLFKLQDGRVFDDAADPRRLDP